MKTPITIITGYLGSGKTSLLQHIIGNIKSRIAIIMNEFGELAIDSRIIKGNNFNMTELQGGCVCCSLTGEFEAAINEIIKTVKPDAIIVETTGVAEPDALLVDIEENIPNVRLDSVITVVDADALVRFPAIGHTGRMQIEMADIIIINKIDLIDTTELDNVEKKVKDVNDKAIIFKSVKGDVAVEHLFGIYVSKKIRRHEKHRIDVNHVIFETDKLLEKEKFEEFIENLPENIYRIKGFVRFKNGSFLFNYVAGRYSYDNFIAGKTELVFIGSNIEKKKILAELERISSYSN